MRMSMFGSGSGMDVQDESPRVRSPGFWTCFQSCREYIAAELWLARGVEQDPEHRATAKSHVDYNEKLEMFWLW